ncbi:MAG: DUF4375 domain-containing protein [Bacteroidetes bacterium]|nr:DUF4375 domain-containing protein [Bacteroidota bacterium]
MSGLYHLSLDKVELNALMAAGALDEAFAFLANPLHDWLYHVQDFDRLMERSSLEQLILSFDYIRMQVGQGGFIQLFQNNYAPLVPMCIEQAQALGLGGAMTKLLDDALKVYVLNIDTLAKETTVEEFGKLYEEFKEFEALEVAFDQEKPSFEQQIFQLVLPKDEVG